jgi:chlorobactene glucosyltransferase
MNLPLLSALIGSLWAATLLGNRRNHRITPDVERERAIAGQPPSVLVLVPARNEERNLGACLQALAASDYPRLKILVVDDGSTDGTGEIVRAASLRDARITTMRIDDLPADWLGKNYALWRGTRGVTDDWLLFLDADVRVTPSCVTRAVAAAQRYKADLLTMVIRIETQGFWEIAVQSVIAHCLLLLFNPAMVNSPAYPRAVTAFGPFMLVGRQAYESIGGHAAVRGEVVEDLRLAEAFKGSGRTVIIARGIGLASLRMYDSLAAIMRGWSKNAFIKRTKPDEIATPPWSVPLSVIGILVLYESPWVLFIRSVLHGCVFAIAASAGALAIAILAQLDFSRLYRIDSRWPWLAPIGALVACWILISASLRVALGKPADWKGRAVG